ncbi:acyltransferase [Bacillus sp. NP157]|nr:acyltransferase [Bacillus sp. NP157]
MKSQANGHTYFPYIDGLRALAVLAVMLYHLNSAWLPGGFSGVDVFFVISGYVVATSVGSRPQASLPSFASYFVARRLQRIAPALVVCLLVTALVDAVFVPDAWLSHRNQVTGRFAFFGFSNVVMARADNDYFSPIAELNPYTHTWSLGVEEQFYLLFPVLFFLWLRGGRWRWGVTAVTAAASLSSLVYGAWLGPRDPTQAFYLLGSRFWEIGAGVLLYQLQALWPAAPLQDAATSQRHWLVGALASLALVIAGFVVSQPGSFPAPGGWMPVLGTLGLLLCLRHVELTHPFVRVLAEGPMATVGRLSYSLYLWHWPVFVLFRWTIGLATWPLQGLAVALSGILAVASYRYIETPARRAEGLRRLPRPMVAALGLAFVFSGLWVMKQITHSQPVLSVSTVTTHARDWYPDAGRIAREAPACAVPSTSVALGKGSRQTFEGSRCTSEPTAPNVYVIGDSHAVALSEMLAGYARDTGAVVTLYENEGCPFLSLQAWRDDTVHCAASSQRVLDDLVTRVKPGDVVFLPSLRMPRHVDQWAVVDSGTGSGGTAPQPASAGGDTLQASVARGEPVLARIQATGARTVITAPNLLLKLPLFRCADSYDRMNPVCRAGADVDRATFEKQRAPMLAAVHELAASQPNASVWDPFPLMCPPGPVCHAYLDGHPLFFDGDHVSGFTNRLLLPAFERAMRATRS